MLKQEPCRITVFINRVKNKFQICIKFAIYFSHCLTLKQYYLDVLFVTTVDKVYVSERFRFNCLSRGHVLGASIFIQLVYSYTW